MSINKDNYNTLLQELPDNVCLVAVSKTKPVEDIQALYTLGQRDFGENYVQELTEKESLLPKDINWHFIGHLQSNKVKYIAPFVHLIHGVDSFKLLKEINKEAAKNNRTIDCLLQMYIAKEETKFGLDENELRDILTQKNSLPNVRIRGLMGMASFTEDMNTVRQEFRNLHSIFKTIQNHNIGIDTLSMGMSGDYKIAIEEGSTMIRVGSLLFGARNYNQ